MNSIAGAWTLGEAADVRAAVARRQSEGFSLYGWYGLVILGASLGLVMSPNYRGPGMAIGVVCAMLGYAPIATYFARKNAKKHWTQIGLPSELSLNIALESEGFSYRLGEMQYLASWAVVTDLFFSKGYWVFMVQGTALPVPARFFADKPAERLFVASALSRMSGAARQRSPIAVNFAEVS